jgi:hypothetical protein
LSFIIPICHETSFCGFHKGEWPSCFCSSGVNITNWWCKYAIDSWRS